MTAKALRRVQHQKKKEKKDMNIIIIINDLNIIKRRQPSSNAYLILSACFSFILFCRLMTYSYLTVFNFWLILFPYNLSHDWQMGSILPFKINTIHR